MLVIKYPEPAFLVRDEAGKKIIFDSLRKKWLLLTPEEWVRQNFVQYLLQVKKYPATLIAQEKTIRLGDLKKRFDILVYDRNHLPWMMIECKAPSVTLEESVFHQLLRYHITVPAAWLVITNGSTSFGWEKRGGQLLTVADLPDY